MEIALYSLLFVAGLGLALVASDVAVAYTRALAAALGAPPFIVGVVLVSLGTDLPEIANSIAAHVQDEGDVNVGDSIGSTLTQYTLVLGLFPLVAGALAIDRRQIGVVTVLTMCGLGLTSLFVADGWLGRWDGLALVVAWAVFTYAIVRVIPGSRPEDPPAVRLAGRGGQTVVVLGALAVVGVGATVAVRSLVRLAELAGVPEFIIAFFGASLGTSAPEIVVDFTALVRGSPAIALGDALGSSLIDATLSIGIGPLVAPAAVTAGLALTGAIYTFVAVGAVGGLLGGRRRHDRRSMAVLLSLYLLAYAVLLSAD